MWRDRKKAQGGGSQCAHKLNAQPNGGALDFRASFVARPRRVQLLDARHSP
jgi:hypothetical protein